MPLPWWVYVHGTGCMYTCQEVDSEFLQVRVVESENGEGCQRNKADSYQQDGDGADDAERTHASVSAKNPRVGLEDAPRPGEDACCRDEEVHAPSLPGVHTPGKRCVHPLI